MLSTLAARADPASAARRCSRSRAVTCRAADGHTAQGMQIAGHRDVTMTGPHEPPPYGRPGQPMVTRYVAEYVLLDHISRYHARVSHLTDSMC